jgi:hypothetical protein
MNEISEALEMQLKPIRGIESIGYYFEDSKPHLVVRIYKRRFNNRIQKIIPETFEGLPVEIQLIQRSMFLHAIL